MAREDRTSSPKPADNLGDKVWEVCEHPVVLESQEFAAPGNGNLLATATSTITT